MRGRSARFNHQLLIQIDRELVAGRRLAVFEQTIENQLGNHHGQQTVFKRIGIENVGKGRRDDAAETVLHQSPWRMFAT